MTIQRRSNPKAPDNNGIEKKIKRQVMMRRREEEEEEEEEGVVDY